MYEHYSKILVKSHEAEEWVEATFISMTSYGAVWAAVDPHFKQADRYNYHKEKEHDKGN